MGQREAFLLSRGPFYSLYSRAELIKKKKKNRNDRNKTRFAKREKRFFQPRVLIPQFPLCILKILKNFRLLIEQENVNVARVKSMLEELNEIWQDNPRLLKLRKFFAIFQ